MSSKIEIVNLGLTLLGQRPITSLSAENDLARKVNIVWQPAVDETLQSQEWNFATKQKQLALLADDEVHGYEYVYKRPGSFAVPCLKIQKVYDEDFPITSKPNDFTEMLVGDSEQQAIACDIEEAWAQMTIRVADTSKFTPAFVKALAYKLAAELAIPISADKNLAKAMNDLFYAKTSDAMRLNSTAKQEKKETSSKYIDCR